MEQENFLVLGSNSFSGAWFIDTVLRDNPAARVAAVSRSPEAANVFLPYKRSGPERVAFQQIDLNAEPERIVAIAREFAADYIVNFAAQGMVAESWQHPEHWFQTNCLGLLRLAQALSESGLRLKRFVQVSSPEVYGASSGEAEEQCRLLPSTPYAASKAAGDLCLYPYFLHRGLPVVYTRATNVYGPCQQLYRIIPRTVLYLRAGRRIQLHGGGRAVKSYLHIRDACDATLRVARHGRSGEVYHISPDGSGISIRDLVTRICRLMGKDPAACTESVAERFGQDSAYAINSDKIRRELGWQPRIGLEVGIGEVIAWVAAHDRELQLQPREYRHQP